MLKILKATSYYRTYRNIGYNRLNSLIKAIEYYKRLSYDY